MIRSIKGFLKDNYITFTIASLVLLVKSIGMYWHYGKNSALDNFILVVNSFDFVFYFSIIFVFLLKNIYLRLNKVISFFLFAVYPVSNQIKVLKNTILAHERDYLFTGYTFKTLSRRALFKIIAFTEISYFKNLLNVLKQTQYKIDIDDLYTFYFEAIYQINIDSYEELTISHRLPKELIDLIFDKKTRKFKIFYRNLVLSDIVNPYFYNQSIISLLISLIEDYLSDLPEIIDKLNGRTDEIKFRVLEEDGLIEYEFGSNLIQRIDPIL